MRTFILPAVIMLSVAISCKEPGPFSGIPENDMAEIREWAGVLARYSATHPDDPLRPHRPDEEEMLALERMCNRNPEAWAYLYSCIADTISSMEPPDPSCISGVETYDEEEIEN